MTEAFFVRSRRSVPLPNPLSALRWRFCGLFEPPSFAEFKLWRKLAPTLIEKFFDPPRCHLGQIFFDGARQNRANLCVERARVIVGEPAVKFFLRRTLRRLLEIFLRVRTIRMVH